MPQPTPTDPFGIGTVGFAPTDFMNAAYPYVTFGPNMGFNLLDLQTKANLQGNLANQQMAWNLAQAGGSGNLMDNFARQLYLGGLGPQPDRFSALQGLPSPFIGSVNAAGDYNSILGQLPPWMQGGGNVVQTGAQGAVPGYNEALQANDPKRALALARAARGLPMTDALAPYWPQQGTEPIGAPLPTGGGGMPAAYPSGPRVPTTPTPMPMPSGTPGWALANGGTLMPGETAMVGEAGPEVVRFENGRVVVSPIKYGMQTGGVLQQQENPYMDDMGKPWDWNQHTPTTPTTPQQPNVTDLPFYKQFQTGQVGPAWNANMARPTAPELGINEGVKLPWEVANTFLHSNPQYQMQQLQLWQALGIPPEFAQSWINAATPGYRQFQQRSVGF